MWGIVLLGVALALFFVEVFIPSGGLIGIVAGVAAVFGIVLLFRVDTTLGLVTGGGGAARDARSWWRSG